MLRRLALTERHPLVILGPGAIDVVAEEVARLGARRVLVVSTSGRRPLADELANAIGPLCAGVLGIAEEHVPVGIVAEAKEEALRRKADSFLAVGGGSAVGLAKALVLECPGPIVAVPTTYSGSEMTPIWGVTEGGAKRTGRDERVRPKCVLYDPRLLLSLPKAIAAPSLFNALAHAVEALYAPGADEPVLTWAADAARELAACIRALSEPPEMKAVQQGLLGACLAGACLGEVTMGLHHKLCHVLGGTFGLPHARTHAALLPHVARFNLEASPDARERLGRALGTADPAEALFTLTKDAGVRVDLEGLGLREEALDRVAELAMTNPYPNPRPLSVPILRALLERAIR